MKKKATEDQFSELHNLVTAELALEEKISLKAQEVAIDKCLLLDEGT